MFPAVNYSWYRPNGAPASISISPLGDPAPQQSDGEVDLFSQASLFFGQLNAPNVFTAPVNTFQDVVARRLHATSDPLRKSDVSPLPETEALALVRAVPAYRYDLDGRRAAGVLASDVPEAYVHRMPDGTRCVDYNSLVAELWAGVRDLTRRLEECERRLAAPPPAG